MDRNQYHFKSSRNPATKERHEGLEKRYGEKLQAAAFQKNVTQTLERFDPEAESIEKDDLKFLRISHKYFHSS
jgi:hypothetical protein